MSAPEIIALVAVIIMAISVIASAISTWRTNKTLRLTAQATNKTLWEATQTQIDARQREVQTQRIAVAEALTVEINDCIRESRAVAVQLNERWGSGGEETQRSPFRTHLLLPKIETDIWKGRLATSAGLPLQPYFKKLVAFYSHVRRTNHILHLYNQTEERACYAERSLAARLRHDRARLAHAVTVSHEVMAQIGEIKDLAKLPDRYDVDAVVPEWI